MNKPVLNLSCCSSSKLDGFASLGVFQGLTPLLIKPRALRMTFCRLKDWIQPMHAWITHSYAP